MTKRVAIVDYGMGNLWSVMSAFHYLGVTPLIASEPESIMAADYLVLPGVGSYFQAMQSLKNRGMVDALQESVVIRKRNILGICLGMQLFAEQGTEEGDCLGLGFIPGSVERFSMGELGLLKSPHVGFNSVSIKTESRLFKDIPTGSDFYFIHSYRLMPPDGFGLHGICDYGCNFLASLEMENIFATQFHPEKSQSNGLRLLNNFLTS